MRIEQAYLVQRSTNTTGYCYTLHPDGFDREDPVSRVNLNEMATLSRELGNLHDLIFSFYRLDLDLPDAKKESRLDLELLDQNG